MRKGSLSDEYENLKPINIDQEHPKIKPYEQFRFRSMVAIGNPIVDISANVTDEIIQKYKLVWGETIFANESNVGFFDELQKSKNVEYIPGGSIQNTLRTTSWCINMDPNNKGIYKITMLGATGKDTYRNKIEDAFDFAGVKPLLECIPDKETSRCGVGINKKERCLLPQIRASNMISEKYIKDNMEEIMSHEAVLIEGYFIQLNWQIWQI